MTTRSSDVNIRQSTRARRLTLRVSQLDGRATLTVPRGTSDRATRNFLSDNAQWLDRARARLPETVIVGAGVQLPVEGKLLPVRIGSVRTAKIAGDHIIAPEKNPGVALRTMLKSAAKIRLEDRASVHAQAIGSRVARITLRDTRSRWGSCSEASNLMFSWRLIMAPAQVLDYVAAHEVAHIREMNHSGAFWAIVGQLIPDHKAARKWLRSEGNRLHRYRFD